jgi:hypothetical protein
VSKVNASFEKLVQPYLLLLLHVTFGSYPRGSSSLTLRELEALTGFRTPRLFSLNLAGITGEEATRPHQRSQVLVVLDECPGKPHANRISLPGLTSASHTHPDVELPMQLRRPERLFHSLLVGTARKIFGEPSRVNGPLTFTWYQSDPGNGGLPPAYGLDALIRHQSLPMLSDVEVLGLLPLMRMLRTRINLQLPPHVPSQRILREHTLDR